MEETAVRENIYCSIYSLQLSHAFFSEDKAKLHFSPARMSSETPPKQLSFRRETQHLSTTNAPIVIKHEHKESKELAHN